MLSEKALDMKVQYTSEDFFDDAVMRLINTVLLEVRNGNFKYPRVTYVKHYSDMRVPCHYMEIILDDKETE